MSDVQTQGSKFALQEEVYLLTYRHRLWDAVADKI